MARDENGNWINPNKLSERERMDLRLEQAGLLNYQTKGLSAAEIAQRYGNAGIKVQDKWSEQNYGVDVNQFRNPQVPIQYGPVGQNNPTGLTGPTGQVQSQRGFVSGGAMNEGGVVIGDSGQYVQLANGLVIRAPKGATPNPTQAAISAIRPQEETVTVEQAMKGEINWEDLPVANRKVLLSNPSFYKSGEITKYPAWMQQQIYADPAFDWEQLPKWRKTFFELSSSPAGMGAVQGTTLGMIGGPLGGVIGGTAGTVLGWAAGKSGYDMTKEFWEQENAVAGGFGLLNWLAEQAEKTVGMGFQIANAAADPNKAVTDVLNKESWHAAGSTFEVLGPAWIAAWEDGKGKLEFKDLLKVIPAADAMRLLWEVTIHPEKYTGKEIYLGAENPIALDESWVERIDKAREEIKNGRPYREVMMEMQTGVVAQLSDMAGQAAADPLNFLPNQTTRVGSAIAEGQGNLVAAQALRQSSGLMEAARKYQTLVQTGEALKIDPKFQVDQMSWVSRTIAGITEDGAIKAGSFSPVPTETGLLDPVRQTDIQPKFVKDPIGWVKMMTEQTPHSRAQQGANMFYENVSALLTHFDNPSDAVHYLKALANNDMETWAQLGSRFAESPEFYTVLPALKEFNASQLDGILQQWDMTQTNRDYLTRLADVLGEKPASLLDDLAKRGTKEQDYQRIVQRLEASSDPNAKALLADIRDGRFTAETLAQVVDVFTGDGALPWHPNMWKAMVLDKLGSHFDEWVTKRLMLDKSPEAVSAFYRTTAVMKQAQSILLLGGSPGYAITNGLSNMVNRAVTGNFGYLTSNQINTFLDRMGITPARFDEGVGIGGMVEQAAGRTSVKTEAMTKAVRGKGPLTTAKDNLAKISRGMPFSKLASYFDRLEGKQAYAIEMKKFWSSSWRRGVGFREMSADLVNVIREMGGDPNVIYAAIEAGMNQTEIEKALLGRQEGIQARSLIHDAAQKTGMSASEAARMLEEIGILDTLDTFLKGQTTRDGVNAAFNRAERVAQDWIDMQTGEDLKAIAESVKQRVGLEGAAAALDVVQKAHGNYFDAWFDHYTRFGDVMNDLNLLDDMGQRNKAIEYHYAVSDGEFRRINARAGANYKGIFEAWGLSGNQSALKVLQGISEADVAMQDAYRQMREIRKGFFDKYRNDWDNPSKWDEWNANNERISAIFEQGFAKKQDAEVKMGSALAEIYEGLYGPAAGEAARLWWDDVVEFNTEIVKREREFRDSLEGLTREERAFLKQEYYSKTKVGMIAELEKINGEGIARLERVIKRGPGTADGGRTPNPDPSPVDGGQLTVDGDPTPSPSPKGEGSSAVDEVNALMMAAEQRKAEEARVNAERVASVWDVAEEYWGRGGNYRRDILQDRFALLNALRKEEYGGIPDLFDLSDPRLTPEIVRQVMENRKVIKEGQANEAAQLALTPDPSPKTGEGGKRKFDVTQINNDTNILRAIALHGGIDLKLVADVTGEKRTRGLPGVFTKKGVNIDEMARMLADDGYDINLTHPDDPGGIGQTQELIRRARAGNPVYPKGHDYNADLLAAERAYIEAFDFDTVPEVDPTLWQAEFMETIAQGDLTKMWGMIGDYPESFDPNALNEYVRLADETAARVEAEARDAAVAENFARAEESIREAEVHAEAVMTRRLLLEKFAEAFGLDETKAQAYMELSDSVAGWYARVTGESADEFYSRYYGDSVFDGDALMQKEKAKQQSLWEDGQDTPLFSGVAQRINLEEYKPVAETVKQGNLFEIPPQDESLPTTKVEDSSRTTEGLQDFGEKIGGARKDKAKLQQFLDRELSDADLGRMSLSEIWAKAEVDAIEDPNLAALASTLRSVIPAKPKSSWKLSRWIEQVKTIRELVRLSNDKGVDFVMDRMRANTALNSFAHKVSLLQELPRDSWGRIKEVEYFPDSYIYKDGQKVNKPWAFADVDGKRITSNTWDGLVEEVKKRLEVKQDVTTTIQFEVRRSGDNFFINKKGDPLYRKLKTFTSSNEAFDFIRQSKQELVKAWDDVKESDNVKETDVRREENRPRLGRDHREGKDATPEMFLDKFGFRGVEFGNWVSQGKNIRERQGMLNAAYDALMDLSDVIGVPPRAISLNGELGLGLGSRGSGSASAHYEPNYVVINLTKTRGAGTLAHEWLHALDNYFQKKRGYEGKDKHGGAYITHQPETRYRNNVSGETLTVDRFTKLSERRAIRNPEQWVKVEGVRPEVEQSFTELVKALNESPMSQRSEMIDKGQGGYWSRIIERAARSFENYVIEKMAKMGYENDYLANVSRLEEFNRNPERYPYLRNEELAPVVDAFDKLFSTIQTRKTDKGIELYQSAKGAVTFDETGIKATIRAFEAADFSTLIHENGHVFRRVLKDVAERTGNPYIKADLDVIEQWAGVKDGVWERVHEEKFARGFERYIAEGKAPTPALARAFESFKKWMLEIYVAITGSAIDVKLTDDVRRVFDRMLGAENLRIDLESQLLQMNYDPKKFTVDTYTGNVIPRPEFNMNVKDVNLDAFGVDMESLRARAETLREKWKQPAEQGGGFDFEAWGKGYRKEAWADIVDPRKNERVKALTQWSLEKMADGRRQTVDDPNILFQEANVPFGKYDEASKFMPESEARDAGWSQFVRPLLEEMRKLAVDGDSNQLSVISGQLPENGNRMLRRYMKEVQNDMATTKLATVRWAEKQRDFGLLNYNRRYGADRTLDAGYPYQFYYTRSLFTYGARAMDMPALYSNYARMRMQQDRYERDIPERLRGKIKISAPWLPDWMGDALYIDPIGNLFFPANVLRPFERAERDKNYQVIEAERILQEWAASGEYAENEIMQAVNNRSGVVWERAFAEAQIRRESEIANPMDFFSSMFGPAWYLSTPLNLLGVKTPWSKGDPNKVSPTPLGNTSRAIDTVTQGTWAEPFGDIIGLIGKVEDWGREKVGLPTRGEYGEYYTKRQLANMVAEGLLSPDEAQLAMIEKSGAHWDEAARRVDMELAMRVPGMSALYATLHEGPVAGMQAFLPSLFGAGILPEGELEFRGLKQEWNEAWKKADAGDETAVRDFFDAHPEYEAYLAKGKDDGELLRSFLIGQIWDKYMELGETNQRLARAEMGEEFQQAFLNKETRSYETLDVETLTAWARMLNGMIPKTVDGGQLTVSGELPKNGNSAESLKLYDESVTGITDQYFHQRTERFPNWYETQQGYYALPKSERASYLLAHPELKAYWSWKDSWFKAYPEYVPIFNGQAFKRVDTSGWNPLLVDYLTTYAYTGGQLPSGARKALEQVWILEGRPMGDLDTWLNSEVVPAMLYSN